MRKNIFIIGLLTYLGAFKLTSFVFALETKWPSSPSGIPITDDITLTVFIQYLYEWSIAIGGLAAFFALIWAGFLYLTSAGNTGRIKEAKERINSAVLGLVLLLSSFLILNTINPQLTTLSMPIFGAKSGSITGIGPLSSPDILKSCISATLFQNEGFRGQERIILPDEEPNFTKNFFDPKSIDMDGYCQVELYTNSSCIGKPITVIAAPTKDLESFYLGPIGCVKILKRSQPSDPSIYVTLYNDIYNPSVGPAGASHIFNSQEGDITALGWKTSAIDISQGAFGIIYYKKDFEGEYRVVTEADPDLTNDAVRPVYNLDGTPDTSWNDKASSVKVLKNLAGVGAILYLDTNFGGSSLIIDGDIPDLREKKFLGGGFNTWSNVASSIKILPGYTVTIYDTEQYDNGGIGYKLTSDSAKLNNLDRIGWNDRITSIKISR
ncbi:MAG: hypothetical protein Q7T34_00595 [Candidatus Parcubacteria bacterium]|nr:hypothetical protein [Candidatus Parcubacteria bacterium]